MIDLLLSCRASSTLAPTQTAGSIYTNGEKKKVRPKDATGIDDSINSRRPNSAATLAVSQADTRCEHCQLCSSGPV